MMSAVYITGRGGYELEVLLSLMDEGIYVGVYTEGPEKGVEVPLTSRQAKAARVNSFIDNT
tara:strand:- start:201 stop:383 length:183 start_codon:yes stop_codon:yes gene_type:complete